jgi:putative cell wall-binding protein
MSVVVATGEDWPDALGGSALAAAAYGPILLTDPDGLRSDVLAEIQRLDPDQAYVLGGTTAVAAAVEEALDDELGEGNVDRIGGSDRYRTADLIAEEVQSIYGDPSAVFVATGLDYPDAVAASPLAAAWRLPILLTPPDGLRSSTENVIGNLSPDTALILGGTTVVQGEVATDLEGIVGAGNVERLWGANRYATAADIAEYGYNELMLSYDNLALATGESFADALTGGVLQGREKSLLLLTAGTSLSGPTESRLSAHADEIGRLRFLGGTAAIGQDVRDDAEALLP